MVSEFLIFGDTEPVAVHPAEETHCVGIAEFGFFFEEGNSLAERVFDFHRFLSS